MDTVIFTLVIILLAAFAFTFALPLKSLIRYCVGLVLISPFLFVLCVFAHLLFDDAMGPFLCVIAFVVLSTPLIIARLLYILLRSKIKRQPEPLVTTFILSCASSAALLFASMVVGYVSGLAGNFILAAGVVLTSQHFRQKPRSETGDIRFLIIAGLCGLMLMFSLLITLRASTSIAFYVQPQEAYCLQLPDEVEARSIWQLSPYHMLAGLNFFPNDYRFFRNHARLIVMNPNGSARLYHWSYGHMAFLGQAMVVRGDTGGNHIMGEIPSLRYTRDVICTPEQNFLQGLRWY